MLSPVLWKLVREASRQNGFGWKRLSGDGLFAANAASFAPSIWLCFGCLLLLALEEAGCPVLHQAVYTAGCTSWQLSPVAAVEECLLKLQALQSVS